MSETVLVYLGSEYIVDYVSRNPVDWSNGDLARRGGVGDQAGIPPTTSVGEFLSLLGQRQKLFTQEEYANHCFASWAQAGPEWFSRLTSEHRTGLRAKLFRNFYPAMIDTLHVWALLIESGDWQRCIIDSYSDACGKTDLTLESWQGIVRVALLAGSSSSVACREYKNTYRSSIADDLNIVPVRLSMDRPRSPGNKRWYRIEDFAGLPAQVESITPSSNVTPAIKLVSPKDNTWF